MSKKIQTPALSISVTGGARTVANMKTLRKSMQEAIFVRAIKPALADMMKAAKANVMGVPSRSGGTTRTRQAIASRVSIKLQRAKGSRYYSKGRLAVFYGKPRGSAPKQKIGDSQPLWVRASLAHLIEYGYKLTQVFGRKIRNRRIPERPFMRPAFERNKSKAESLFLRVVRSEMDKVQP